MFIRFRFRFRPKVKNILSVIHCQGRCTPWNLDSPKNCPPWKEAFPDIRPPKANGHYHPLAISSPSYWIPSSVIGIRFPKANGHYLPLDIVLPVPFADIILPEPFLDIVLPEILFGHCRRLPHHWLRPCSVMYKMFLGYLSIKILIVYFLSDIYYLHTWIRVVTSALF